MFQDVVFIVDRCSPNESGALFFKVQVNTGVLENTTISNYSTTYYKHEGVPTEYSSMSTIATSTIGLRASIDLSPNRTGSGNPSDQIYYQFTVTNNGNAADRVNITYTSTRGWIWTFWVDVDGNGIPGTDGDYQLTDTNSDGIIDTGVLTPNGGYITIFAVTTIPAGTSDGTIDITTITGTSVRNSSVYDSITLTTTVTAPVLQVTKTVSPSGPQPPGTELTYTITVRNIGTGTATSVVITDPILQHTTYVPNSIYTGPDLAHLTQKTDAADGDGARYDSATNTVIAGSGGSITIGPGGSWVLQFKVKID